MIFNSLTFLIFLCLVVVLYWFLPKKIRLILIFISSLIFYGFWRVEFVGLVLFSTFIDYIISIQLEREEHNDKKRKILVLLSLILNLGLLVYFKYSYFIVDNLNWVLDGLLGMKEISIFEIILPLGISFYTFQTISYTIDVYRRHIKAEKNFVLYGCYVTFFPQLVAGPVLRASEVMSQLSLRPKFQFSFLLEGIKRIFYGLFLKVVLADNIASLVNYGYNIDPELLSAIDVWTLGFLFGFQIYFDFAGYSHIAIGCASLMGVKFVENFNYPYAARSFKSFWKRWHISLSSWIRDYLYLPLTGAKVIDASKKSTGGISISVSQNSSASRRNFALFTTWFIMGLWHGANWTFAVWGIFHAVMIFLERKFKFIRTRISFFNLPTVGWIITLPIAMIAWIPFRADNLNDTFVMFAKVLDPFQYTFLSMRENIYLVTFLLTLFTTLAYVYSHYLQERIEKYFLPFILVNSVKYSVLIFLVYTFFRPINQFIYFQF